MVKEAFDTVDFTIFQIFQAVTVAATVRYAKMPDDWLTTTSSQITNRVCVYSGHAEVLLDAMKEASVSGALIIQPGNHLYDHSYVTSVLKAYPDKFVGMLLANPTDVSFPPCNTMNLF